MNKQYDVAALGELLIDFTENGTSGQGNPVYEANPGGAPCNVLSMLNKLGHHTAFLGKVGDDIIADAKIFHFGTLSMTNEPVRSATRHAIKVAKENGAILSFDPNIREPLWKDMEDARTQMAYALSVCDILKISDNEIQWFSGKEDYTEGIHMLQQTYQIPLILLSMGKDGSRAYYKDMLVEVPAFLQKNTIETTGAGDTFGACCLHHILKYGLDNLTKQQLKEMLTFANAAASIITTRKGALRVMPSLEEIQRLL